MSFQTDVINACQLQELWENGADFKDLKVKMKTQNVWVHSAILYSKSEILKKLMRDGEICFPDEFSDFPKFPNSAGPKSWCMGKIFSIVV